MAGIQIDGVNNKIDFDDDADTSISSATDDTLVIEVGGSTLATVTATSVTFNDGVEITTADNTDQLTLTSTDADATVGPRLRIYRNSSSPADNDAIGDIRWEGRNDNSQDFVAAQLVVVAQDVSDGTEDSYANFKIMKAGSQVTTLSQNATEVTINDGSQDIDFRVESNGNTHAFFVEGGTDEIGMFTSNPSRKVHIVNGSADLYSLGVNNSNGSGTQYGQSLFFSGSAPDDTTSVFLLCVDTSANRLAIFSDGDVQNHDNSYGALSDERIKQDIKDANSQWDDIKALKIRNYKKKDDVRQHGDKAWEQIGVIAQELESASMDKLIKHSDPSSADIASDSSFGTLYEDGDTLPKGKEIGDVKEVKEKVKGVKYSVLYMKAIKALQEAMAKIETLETKVKALEDA